MGTPNKTFTTQQVEVGTPMISPRTNPADSKSAKMPDNTDRPPIAKLSTLGDETEVTELRNADDSADRPPIAKLPTLGGSDVTQPRNRSNAVTSRNHAHAENTFYGYDYDELISDLFGS